MNKNFYIFGGGFGLYGYVPALIKIKKKVFLDQKYKKKITSRNDISHLNNKIKYLIKLPNKPPLLYDKDFIFKL